MKQTDYLKLLRQQTILARFGELALESDNLDKVLTEACRLVGEALGTDLSKVMELQEDGETLLVRAGVGWTSGIVGKVTLKAVEGSSEGYALKTGEPMISPDIAAETRFRYAPFLIENGVKAVANVVIIGGHDRRPYGILQIDSREPHWFTDDDTAFLRGYANLLAASVNRLRVIAEMRNLEVVAQARKQAEEALRRSNEELGVRVAERTRELLDANTQLRAEARERERVEDVLRQSQKMEAVGQLTGGLAHDFNNLLAGISGSLELIRTRVTQGRIAELGRHIDTAMASADRAAALTHRLLAFSRRQTLDPKPTDMNQLIGGMMDLLSHTVGPSLQISVNLTREPWQVLCDPNQLESALLNIVLNARDAMPNGGHLVIETSNAVLSDRRGAAKDIASGALAPGDYMILSVTDTGIGMPRAAIERAFDPFYTTKPIGQGTGLGLSMVYGFVQQSGGHVQLRSVEGQGTTVTICLPRHSGTLSALNTANVNAAVIPATPASAFVLVVEDEVAVRMIVAEVLSELGYTVLEAGDGRSGLNILESEIRIDLLLSDVGLPGGMNGRQLADTARQRRPNLKVLFMTGYDASAAASSGLMDEGMQLITKPFGIHALVAKVQEIIST